MALQRVVEKRTGKRAQYSATTDGNDPMYLGDMEYQYDYMTGWRSDETGEFYELTPEGWEMFRRGESAVDSTYFSQREQVVKQLDWDVQLQRERAQIEAQNAQERANWQAQMQMQMDEYNRQQAEAAAAIEQQRVQFEQERQAREQARIEAEKAKQAKLAAEQKISSETMLGDMLRTQSVKENDLVAAEDKKTLDAQDKEQLFKAGQAAQEDEQKKAKQSFLEALMSGGVTGAPKT